MIKINRIFKICYSIFIFGFAIYLIMDTFVISKVYQTIAVETEESLLNNSLKKENAIITDTSYQDDNLNINLKEYRVNDTTIYVADITTDEKNIFKTALANNVYGKNVTELTSSISNRVGAIIAINGDYYGAQENGYVLKNGQIYRNTSTGKEDLVIYKDGTWQIINENNISLEELQSNGAYNILAFGPALITNGNISVEKNDEVGKAMASNPRTAIGKINDNHYVMVVSDGRTSESKGLSLYELAEFMQSLDCEIAYNLDGGGSSTMIMNNKLINNPTTSGKKISERKVSDIVYVG